MKEGCYWDVIRETLAVPEKKRYQNARDYCCAWVVFCTSLLWLLSVVVRRTFAFFGDINGHDTMDTVLSKGPLRTPSLHICHHTNSSLLDLIAVRSYVISGDDEHYRDVSSSAFENCRLFKFQQESKNLSLGDTVYYDATWTCPFPRYFQYLSQQYQSFNEQIDAKLSETAQQFAQGFRDDFPGAAGDLFCQMGRNLWMPLTWTYADQATSVPKPARALLEASFNMSTLGNAQRDRDKPKRVECSTMLLSFQDAFADEGQKKMLKLLTGLTADAIKAVAKDEASIAWLGSHMTNSAWVNTEEATSSKYERNCHMLFLIEARVVPPQFNHAVGFSFRFSLANYTTDPFATNQEMMAAMQFGVSGGTDRNRAYYRSQFYVAGAARTWRWVDSFGGRRGAEHEDTDYLECFSISGGSLIHLRDPSEEERQHSHGSFNGPVIISGDKFAGSRMSFTYMSGTQREEIFKNNIELTILNYLLSLVASAYVFKKVEKCIFQTFDPKHPKIFRWRVCGLGRRDIKDDPSGVELRLTACNTTQEVDALEAAEAVREAQEHLESHMVGITRERARTLGLLQGIRQDRAQSFG